MRMGIIWRAHVFHFQHIAAFGTALNGAVAGHLVLRKGHWLAYDSLRYRRYVDGRGDCVDANLGWGRWLGAYSKPDSNMRVNGVACAAGVLFVAERFYHDGVVESSWLRGVSSALPFPIVCRDCFSIALIPKSLLFNGPNQTFKL